MVSKIVRWLTSSCEHIPAHPSMANRPFWISRVCMSRKALGSVGLSPSGSNPTSPG